MTPWFDYPQQQWREKHAIVVGAGIAGCQISWHLSSLGWRVTLLESQNSISSQASGNLAGIISPLMSAKASKTEQFYLQAFEYTIQQLKALIINGSDVDWFDCGVLQLAHSEREIQRWKSLKTRDFASELIQLLDEQQASEIAGIPCNNPASYFPQAGYINPASWCNALIDSSNCEVFTKSDVTSLAFNKNKQWGLLGNSGKLLTSADVVVLSNGKHLNQFPQSKQLALSHILGQTSLATAHKASSHLKCAINHEGYVTPSYRNRYVFGATYQREFNEINLDHKSDQQNLLQLSQHLPELANGFTKVSSGHVSVRSATPDRLPYVGGIPDTAYYLEQYADLKHGKHAQRFPCAQYIEGLYALGGLGSRGLTSSALCAKALSELINQSTSPESSRLLNNLHPARFLMRKIKSGTR